MRVHNPDHIVPKKWTYIPTPQPETEPVCEHKWKWFKGWMAPPLGVVIGLSFCLLWPLWIAAAMFAIAPFTGRNQYKKE